MPTNPYHAIVRKVSREQGWCDNLHCFNDKNTYDRRMSYMMNGWPVPQEMKDAIVADVKKRLDMAELSYSKVQWVTSTSYRGDYDKFVIRVPD